MKIILKLVLCYFGFVSTSVIAASQLTLTDGVNLLVLNGKNYIAEGSIFDLSTTVALPEGKNQLVLSYTVEVKKGSEVELETSDPVIISFIVDNQKLRFNLPVIQSEKQFRDFNQQRNWVLRDGNQNNIELDIDALPLKGFRIGVDFEREVERYNKTHNIVVLNQISDKVAPLGVVDSHSSEQAVILKMLQHWYQLASPETQQAFIRSMK